jgi:predicted nucleic acid-binding protein
LSTFVDTSAVLAVLNADDGNHARAAKTWRSLVESGEPLVCTSYTLVELFALVQHRFGLQIVRALEEDVVPMLGVVWVDAGLHSEGVSALLAAARRRLSLVDCVSFACMRRLGITRAFHFDPHFREQGFEAAR